MMSCFAYMNLSDKVTEVRRAVAALEEDRAIFFFATAFEIELDDVKIVYKSLLNPERVRFASEDLKQSLRSQQSMTQAQRESAKAARSDYKALRRATGKLRAKGWHHRRGAAQMARDKQCNSPNGSNGPDAVSRKA